MADVLIEGACEPRFERVKAAFAENFEKRNEYGAAVAITVDGRQVVDLWAGHADKARTRPWTRDTIVNVFSTTKGLTAIAAHRLVDQGLLDLDAPVPEVELGRDEREALLRDRRCESVDLSPVILASKSGAGATLLPAVLLLQWESRREERHMFPAVSAGPKSPASRR